MLRDMEETFIGKHGQLMTTRDGRPYALRTKTGKEIVHGKSSSYSVYACRCRPCTDAHAAKNRKTPISIDALYKDREMKSGFVVSIVDSNGKTLQIPRPSGRDIIHGNRSAYRLGCRCLACQEYADSLWKEVKEDPYAQQHVRKINRDASRVYAEKNPEKVKEAKAKHRDSLPANYSTVKNAKYVMSNPSAHKMQQRKCIEKENERDAFSRSVASRQGLPFTEEEDCLLLSAPGTTLSLALSMSRGLYSIRGRRVLLRKKLRKQGIDPDTMQSFDNQE